MSTALQKAAKIAEKAAKGKGLYYELCAKMCWESVERVAEKTGKYKPKGPNGTNYTAFIDSTVNVIGDGDAMARVPAGAFLGFFLDNELRHAMMATGGGKAAGNKNECIGIGQSVGWEILDLGAANLWNGGKFGKRGMTITYRDTWPGS